MVFEIANHVFGVVSPDFGLLIFDWLELVVVESHSNDGGPLSHSLFPFPIGFTIHSGRETLYG